MPLPKLSFFPPLVLLPNGTLKGTESNDIDDNNFVHIASGEKIVLSCAPNYFKTIESTYLEATCKRDQILGETNLILRRTKFINIFH